MEVEEEDEDEENGDSLDPSIKEVKKHPQKRKERTQFLQFLKQQSLGLEQLQHFLFVLLGFVRPWQETGGGTTYFPEEGEHDTLQG